MVIRDYGLAAVMVIMRTARMRAKTVGCSMVVVMMVLECDIAAAIEGMVKVTVVCLNCGM